MASMLEEDPLKKATSDVIDAGSEHHQLVWGAFALLIVAYLAYNYWQQRAQAAAAAVAEQQRRDAAEKRATEARRPPDPDVELRRLRMIEQKQAELERAAQERVHIEKEKELRRRRQKLGLPVDDDADSGKPSKPDSGEWVGSNSLFGKVTARIAGSRITIEVPRFNMTLVDSFAIDTSVAPFKLSVRGRDCLLQPTAKNATFLASWKIEQLSAGLQLTIAADITLCATSRPQAFAPKPGVLIIKVARGLDDSGGGDDDTKDDDNDERFEAEVLVGVRCGVHGEPVPPANPRRCNCTDGWRGTECNVCRGNTTCGGGFCFANTGIALTKNFHCQPTFDRRLIEFFAAGADGTTLNDARMAIDYDGRRQRALVQVFETVAGLPRVFHCSMRQCWHRPVRRGGGGNADWADARGHVLRCERTACHCDQQPTCNPVLRGIVDSMRQWMEVLCAADGRCRLRHANVPFELPGRCDMAECVPSGYTEPIVANDGWAVQDDVLVGVLSAAAAVCALMMLCVVTMRVRATRYDVGENAKPVLAGMTRRPVHISFRNIVYKVGQRIVLKQVTGSVGAGELLAIMGGSGSGKTTLLDILAGWRKRGAVKGTVLVNSRPRVQRAFRLVSGYVLQHDALPEMLRVREHLEMTAQLALPMAVPPWEIAERVDEVMSALRIDHLAGHLIGGEQVRGISGGEQRRVSIATQLVSAPSVLLLDEPTTGLDATSALVVVRALKDLAVKHGHTIVMSVHQPRHDIFALFDRIVVLEEGECVYSGRQSSCVKFFERQGFRCARGVNYADFVIDTVRGAHPRVLRDLIDASTRWEGGGLTVPTRSRRVQEFRAAQRVHTPRGRNNNDVNDGGKDQAPSPSTVARRGQIRHAENTVEEGEPEATKMRQSSGHLARVSRGSYARRRIGSLRPTSLAASDGALSSAVVHRHGSVQPSTDSAVSEGSSSDEEGDVAAVQSPPHLPPSEAAVLQMLQHSSSPSTAYLRELLERSRYPTSFVNQLLVLSRRTMLHALRSPLLFATHCGVAVLLAGAVGGIYFQRQLTLSGVQDRLGSHFFTLCLFAFGNLSVLDTFVSERAIFLRERESGLYGPAAYYTAKVITDMLMLRIAFPVIFGAIVYPLIGYRSGATAWLNYLAVLVLNSTVSAALMTAIGAAIPTVAVGNILGSLLLLFAMLFGGFLLNNASTPAGVQWLSSLSFFNLAFESLAVNELHGVTYDFAPEGFGFRVPLDGKSFLDQFFFDVADLYPNMAALAGMTVAYLVIGYVLLYSCVKSRR